MTLPTTAVMSGELVKISCTCSSQSLAAHQ